MKNILVLFCLTFVYCADAQTRSDTPTSKPINFLPLPGQISAQKSENINDCKCHNGLSSLSTEYEMVFDNANKELFLFKRKKESEKSPGKAGASSIQGIQRKLKNKIRPTVGRNTNICFTNYNPYTDSIVFSTVFYNRNTEQGQEFQNLLNSSTTGTSTSVKTESFEIATESKKNGSILKDLKILEQQLSFYYETQKNELYINPAYIINGNTIIMSNIIRHFNLGNISELNALKAQTEGLDDKQKDELPILVDNVLYLIRKLNTFNILSFAPAQAPNVDEIEYKFDYYNRGKKINTSSYNYFTKGGFKIDFSGGFFGHGLIDHKYTTKSVQTVDTTFYIDNYFHVRKDSILALDTSSKNIIIRDSLGRFSIGAGIIAHFYFRTGYRVNPTITAGFIIDNNIQTRYLLGGSIIFGQEQRLVLSGGVCLGQVKRLASGLKEGQYYTFANGQSNTIPTKDVWSKSWFVGVSWNFGGVSPSFNKKDK